MDQPQRPRVPAHKQRALNLRYRYEGDEGSEWSDGSRVGAVGTTGGSEHGSAGSSVLAAETMEGTIEAAHKGRGRYAVGSRWHEAMLIEMLRALGSPSLEWRYGDG